MDIACRPAMSRLRKRARRGVIPVIALLLVSMSGSGCAIFTLREVVPEQLADEAELAGMPHVRVWGDAPSKSLASLASDDGRRGRAVGELSQRLARQPINILAISGGGDNGAFGAGLLIGWSDAGTRPDFDLVTGVSAGALSAPLVYLGRSRNAELRDVFTNYGRDDIYDPGIVTPLLGAGLVDSSPLEKLIAKYVDERFLLDIANERQKGRILLIGTTNLDAQRPVLWDMGRIALSRHPQALNLFRKVLLASASIPGAFPPVRIKVRADGRFFEELHVDGGVTQQVFASTPSAPVTNRGPSRATAARLFIIRNGKINPEWEAVETGIFAISRRSIATLIKNQGVGDLYRIFTRAQIEGTDFNLAAIPSWFSMSKEQSFERTYMQTLYDEGYRSGLVGYRWMKVPPGLTDKLKVSAPQPSDRAGLATSSPD